jgi:hypothetical protein
MDVCLKEGLRFYPASNVQNGRGFSDIHPGHVPEFICIGLYHRSPIYWSQMIVYHLGGKIKADKHAGQCGIIYINIQKIIFSNGSDARILLHLEGYGLPRVYQLSVPLGIRLLQHD